MIVNVPISRIKSDVLPAVPSAATGRSAALQSSYFVAHLLGSFIDLAPILVGAEVRGAGGGLGRRPLLLPLHQDPPLQSLEARTHTHTHTHTHTDMHVQPNTYTDLHGK